MAECIEREKLIKEVRRLSTHYLNEWDTLGVLAAIDRIPAADVRPVVRGEWEHTEDFDEYGGGRYVEWTCSVCFSKAKGGWAVRDEHIDEAPTWNFCPNCGARMEES